MTAPRSATVCADNWALAKRIGEALGSAGHRVDRHLEGLEEFRLVADQTSTDLAVVGACRFDTRVAAGLRQVVDCLGDAPLVVVCDRASTGDIRRALEAGADGFVIIAELEETLGAVAAAVTVGQVCVPAERRGEVAEPVLTTREKQILSLVVMGLANAQIARELFVAESTVKSHLSSAFAKLGVSSRNEAVALILDPERGRGLRSLTILNERLDARSPDVGRAEASETAAPWRKVVCSEVGAS